MSDNTISLAEWLDGQIGKNKPFRSNLALANATGLDESTIRRLRKGELPKFDTLRKLANGLKYPESELLRMAGILADDQEVQDDLLNYIEEGAKRLPESQRRSVWKLIQSLLEEQERGNG